MARGALRPAIGRSAQWPSRAADWGGWPAPGQGRGRVATGHPAWGLCATPKQPSPALGPPCGVFLTFLSLSTLQISCHPAKSPLYPALHPPCPPTTTLPSPWPTLPHPTPPYLKKSPSQGTRISAGNELFGMIPWIRSALYSLLCLARLPSRGDLYFDKQMALQFQVPAL